MFNLLAAIVTILDEASVHGLRVWYDGEWYWAWETDQYIDELTGSAFGLGSALRDALVARLGKEFR
jgi:hypothetical protein